MAAALVQSKTGEGIDPTVTFDASVTSGNLVEVTCNQGDDANTLTFVVTDNKGNTYLTNATTLRSTGASGTVIQKFYIYNVVGGASFAVSVDQSVNTNPIAVTIAEFSGVETAADPLDKTAEGTNTNTTPITGSSGTLSQADELVTYAVGSRLAALQTADPTAAGFDRFATQTTTGEWGAQSAHYKVVAATTAVAGDGALANQTWVTVLATYKAGTAAAAADHGLSALMDAEILGGGGFVNRGLHQVEHGICA